jgi:ABC-type nitrate/sulfonate/bicarbonate transport system permease component
MSAQPNESPALSRRPEEQERVILGALVVVLFLFFWEGLERGWWADVLRPLIGASADRWTVKPIFISSPTRVATAAYRMFFVTGEIWPDLKASATEYALALLLAVVLGAPLGLAAGWYRRLSYAVAPFLTGLNATPQIALLPIIIVWFGTGLASKVLIVFLLAVLPIAISAQSGVRTIDPRLIRLASSFGASECRRFRTIVVPSTVPYLLTGVRLAIGRGMIGIVVGEIYGSAAGVGAMINQAGSRFQTDKVFVGILAIVIAGSILAEIVRQVERLVEVWRPPV